MLEGRDCLAAKSSLSEDKINWILPKLKLVNYPPNPALFDYDPPVNLKQISVKLTATDSSGLVGDIFEQMIKVENVNEAPYWKSGSINGWTIQGDGTGGKK